MAKEFAGVDRLRTLNQDAKQASAFLEQLKAEKEGEHIQPESGSPPQHPKARHPSQPTSETVSSVELANLSPSPAATVTRPAPHDREAPVSLSTLVSKATKRRLARAAHLQAASEVSPCTQWEIVEAAINEWCDKFGY